MIEEDAAGTRVIWPLLPAWLAVSLGFTPVLIAGIHASICLWMVRAVGGLAAFDIAAPYAPMLLLAVMTGLVLWWGGIWCLVTFLRYHRVSSTVQVAAGELILLRPGMLGMRTRRWPIAGITEVRMDPVRVIAGRRKRVFRLRVRFRNQRPLKLWLHTGDPGVPGRVRLAIAGAVNRARATPGPVEAKT